jgi:hypothetical protein
MPSQIKNQLQVEWLRRAAAAEEVVGVVDRTGLLVNVGVLSESNDVRKVVFSSAQSSGVCDVWLDDSGRSDESGYVLVPMTPEREERWRLIREVLEVVGSHLPDELLKMILAAVPSGRLKCSKCGYSTSSWGCDDEFCHCPPSSPLRVETKPGLIS